MSLEPGRKLGAYEIVAPIGKGGMGEVYRARDPRLERDVAIKVLPDELASDEGRVARFEREAKLLASLNHPNIASIHGFEESDGVKALVLELVEGPTLAERIEQGPIPVEEAIAIAKQVAEALEAGHEAGIVHRDLKPANIKLKEDGTVKVLDYGLAKALEDDTPPSTGSELSQSPTLTRQGTQIGVILGTAAYMSPEQAKGKHVDKRADIWAFGAVVFEMLSGTRAFGGEDVSDTLAAVLRAEPSFDALPPQTPPSIRELLRLCLTKDVKGRTRDIGDARLVLGGAFGSVAKPDDARATTGGWRTSTLLATGLGAGIAVGLAIWSTSRPVETEALVTRFSIPLPPGTAFSGVHLSVLALSPDGSRIVFNANDRLYERAMNDLTATPLEGTEGAENPFFSSDGRWVGFHAGGGLKKISAGGGFPVDVCRDCQPWGASWSEESIVYGGFGSGVARVPAEGGETETLLSIDSATSYGPQMLPGGDVVLHTLGRTVNFTDSNVVVHTLDTGASKTLVEGGRGARYTSSSHLLYVVDHTLLAAPFDVDSLELTGAPVALAEGVSSSNLSGAAQFAVSDRALAYVARVEPQQLLVWVDRDGKEEATGVAPGYYRWPRIAPDGGRAAFQSELDVWTWDFGRETLTRLTSASGFSAFPAWTPDGSRILFVSNRSGRPRLYWAATDGTGEAEDLALGYQGPLWPWSFSADGTRFLLHTGGIVDDTDLILLILGGSTDSLLATEFSERHGHLSPDGRWIVYQSDVSGETEIYVRPFPNVEDGLWPISSGGGSRPVWSRRGDELFYIAHDRRMMAVAIQTEPGFLAENPRTLFVLPRDYLPSDPAVLTWTVSNDRNYDVAPNGNRFLMVKNLAKDRPDEIIVIQNWREELERRIQEN